MSNVLARLAVFLRAGVFVLGMQYVLGPLVIRRVMRAAGSRFGLRNDHAHHVLSSALLLIQDVLVIALALLLARVLRGAGRTGFGDVLRSSHLRGARPWRMLAAGGMLAALVLAAVMLTEAAVGHVAIQLRDHGMASIARHQLLLVACFAAVGASEEIVNRGYPLHELARGIGFWPAAVATSALFGWGHFAEGDSAMGSLGVFAFAMVACASLRATGSLWFAIGYHAAWDYGESGLLGIPDSSFLLSGALGETRVTGMKLLTGGAAGPEGSVLTIAVLAVMFAWFFRMERRLLPAGSVIMRNSVLAAPA